MTDEADKQPAPAESTHPDDDKRQDQELRKHALDISRGPPHKLVSQIVEDAKYVYHFLTTKSPLVDKTPSEDVPPAASNEPWRFGGAQLVKGGAQVTGPIEHYSDQSGIGRQSFLLSSSDEPERPPASDENATVSPPGVPVLELPHTDPAYPDVAEVDNPSPSAREI